MTVRERLAALRQKMKASGVDACLIVTEDFHGSEYVGDYFKCRAYFSGFTGSAGTLAVLAEEAGLWTDGRYFLQAEDQLAGSGVDLYRMGEPGVPTVAAFLQEKLGAGMTLAFDGRTVSAAFAAELRRDLAAKGAEVRGDLDLAGAAWPDRPPISRRPAFLLGEEWAGAGRGAKLAAVREKMAAAGADTLLLTSLDDIGWLLNLRGDDVAYTPVVLAYLAVTAGETVLFVNDGVIGPEVSAALAADGVRLAPYDGIYAYAAALTPGSGVWMDRGRVNDALWSAVPEGVRVIDKVNPTLLPKAVKNETEVKNERAAHVKDGAALTRFIYWLKHAVGKETITERSAADKLESFRRAQADYLGQSFAPIMAYGPHGAIVHYSATEESDVPLKAEGLLLADTGGHYLQGTTDVTRTIALGPVTAEQKRHYTAVLRGNLRLAGAVFRRGCRGSNLDYLAREPLWRMGLDYNHGTGHGVGYLLSVHEGPNAIRWRETGGAALEPGMITSDEPGLYLTGAYGIRLENLVVCVEKAETEYGSFLGFEPLTLAPFDLDAVAPEEMTPEERGALNAYHRRVRETIGPLLPPEEAAWLETAARDL